MHDARDANEATLYRENDSLRADAQAVQSACVFPFKALDVQAVPFSGGGLPQLLQRIAQRLPGAWREGAQERRRVPVLKDEPVHRSSRSVHSYASG